eukprot:3986930-Prymnesium_polylepis.1
MRPASVPQSVRPPAACHRASPLPLCRAAPQAAPSRLAGAAAAPHSSPPRCARRAPQSPPRCAPPRTRACTHAHTRLSRA